MLYNVIVANGREAMAKEGNKEKTNEERKKREESEVEFSAWRSCNVF